MARRRVSIPEGVFEANIINMSHEGRGIAEVDGKKIFISGALPGETVEFSYTFVKKNMAEGRVVNVIKASNDRVTPPCEAYSICGGCQLQHMSMHAQIKHKQAMVLEQFKLFAKAEPKEWLEPFEGPSLGYRTKARIGVRIVPKKGGALVGFREKFSNRLAVMDACEVLAPSIGKRIHALKELLNTFIRGESIPQIEIAVTDNESALVVRHVEPLHEDDKAALIAFCIEHKLSLYGQSKGFDSVTKLYVEDSTFLLNYQLPAFGLTLFFHPLEFTQVNQTINQMMIEEAIEKLEINSEDSVLDLFCGIGNFTLPLATKAKEVVGVEGSASAIERANFNATYNKITNTEYFVENLFQPPFEAPWALRHYNKVLLDPPRSGAAQVLPWLQASKPEMILYISCNPATLARDTSVLVHEMGYTFESLRIMDMFPHTSHVECMALFKR